MYNVLVELKMANVFYFHPAAFYRKGVLKVISLSCLGVM